MIRHYNRSWNVRNSIFKAQKQETNIQKHEGGRWETILQDILYHIQFSVYIGSKNLNGSQINNDFGKNVLDATIFRAKSQRSCSNKLYTRFWLRLPDNFINFFLSGSENEGKTKYLRFLLEKLLIIEIT